MSFYTHRSASFNNFDPLFCVCPSIWPNLLLCGLEISEIKWCDLKPAQCWETVCVPWHIWSECRALISDRGQVSHHLEPPSINQSTKPNHDPQLTNRQVLKANSWRITHGPTAFYGLAWKISWEHGTNNDIVQKQGIFKEKNISQMSLFAACLTAHVKWLPHSHCRDSSHFSDKESVKGREEEQLDLET